MHLCVTTLPTVENLITKGFLFLRSEFNALYAEKGFDLKQIDVIKGNNRELSLIVSIKNSAAKSPVSAPFGGVTAHRDNLSLTTYISGINLIKNYLLGCGVNKLSVVLPPECYGQDTVAKQVIALNSADFTIKFTDISHALILDGTSFDYRLKAIAKRSLKTAQRSNLLFAQCFTDAEKSAAYAVIKKNRLQRRYPLRLSLRQIQEVSKLATVDFFVVRRDDLAIAAAIVYRISPDVAQVVYWGNDIRYNEMCPTHFLASRLHEFYTGSVTLLDIGPSSQCGIVNEGLCRFKESLGCRSSLKYTLECIIQ